MFEIDRTFSQRNAQTGLMEWFFNAREGVYGPFSSKERSSKALEDFIKFNHKNFDDGGRGSNGNAKLSLVSIGNAMNAIKLDDVKRKRGLSGSF
ncbi:MAG: hypothetical protein ACXV8Q_19050 [Methylobacter sp.]